MAAWKTVTAFAGYERKVRSRPAKYFFENESGKKTDQCNHCNQYTIPDIILFDKIDDNQNICRNQKVFASKESNKGCNPRMERRNMGSHHFISIYIQLAFAFIDYLIGKKSKQQNRYYEYGSRNY